MAIRRYTGTRTVTVEIGGKEFTITAEYSGYSDPGRTNCPNDFAYPPEGDESETDRTYDADGVEVTDELFKAAIMEAMESELEKCDLDESC